MYLGIDIGTSSVKTILIGDTGAIVAQAGCPLKLSRPAPGFSEQDPQEWWRATVHAIRALPESARTAVQAVALSGQMHGAALLDVKDQPLRPAILWNDGRAADECLELERREPAARAITGNMLMPGFTAPKLLCGAAARATTSSSTPISSASWISTDHSCPWSWSTTITLDSRAPCSSNRNPSRTKRHYDHDVATVCTATRIRGRTATVLPCRI